MAHAYHGILPALVTPFRDDERIDYGAWQKIIDALIDAGVHGLFACGSQGEFCALTTEERSVALRFCLQAAAGRVPVFGNVGCVTTSETIHLAQAAQAMGVNVAVVVTPYYIKPSQQELEEHYVDVCRSVHMPVMAYNFPHHGGVELQPETLGRIAARCENLVGLKDSSGRFDRAEAYLRCSPGRPLAVFVANESLIVSGLDAGAAGAVTSSATLAPKLFVDLYRAVRENRRDDAARLQTLAEEVGSLNGLHTFPSVIKAAMQMAGLPAGPCRRPVGPLPDDARRKTAEVVARLHQSGYLPGPARAVSV